MPSSSLFDRIRREYELLWRSPAAEEIDLGNRPYLDELYQTAIAADEFAHLLRRPEGFTVVDLGAGRGSRLAWILSHGRARLVAVDCFASFPGQPLRYRGTKVISDVLRCGLGFAVADVVISAHVILHNPQFQPAESRRAYLREIMRVLKPGGIFWGEEKDLAASEFEALEGIEDYYHLAACYVHCFRKGGTTPQEMPKIP